MALEHSYQRPGLICGPSLLALQTMRIRAARPSNPKSKKFEVISVSSSFSSSFCFSSSLLDCRRMNVEACRKPRDTPRIQYEGVSKERLGLFNLSSTSASILAFTSSSSDPSRGACKHAVAARSAPSSGSEAQFSHGASLLGADVGSEARRFGPASKRSSQQA